MSTRSSLASPAEAEHRRRGIRLPGIHERANGKPTSCRASKRRHPQTRRPEEFSCVVGTKVPLVVILSHLLRPGLPFPEAIQRDSLLSRRPSLAPPHASPQFFRPPWPVIRVSAASRTAVDARRSAAG